uniref:Uncharacterized protein n=1 Tax=Panagrellus redivivus TaxID=6233 RepID=A0A7E4VVD0_PANRE
MVSHSAVAFGTLCQYFVLMHSFGFCSVFAAAVYGLDSEVGSNFDFHGPSTFFTTVLPLRPDGRCNWPTPAQALAIHPVNAPRLLRSGHTLAVAVGREPASLTGPWAMWREKKNVNMARWCVRRTGKRLFWPECCFVFGWGGPHVPEILACSLLSRGDTDGGRLGFNVDGMCIECGQLRAPEEAWLGWFEGKKTEGDPWSEELEGKDRDATGDGRHTRTGGNRDAPSSLLRGRGEAPGLGSFARARSGNRRRRAPGACGYWHHFGVLTWLGLAGRRHSYISSDRFGLLSSSSCEDSQRAWWLAATHAHTDDDHEEEGRRRRRLLPSTRSPTTTTPPQGGPLLGGFRDEPPLPWSRGLIREPPASN